MRIALAWTLQFLGIHESEDTQARTLENGWAWLDADWVGN